MNGVEKIVFSTTLESAGWTNARVIGSDVEAQVRALKAGPGGTIADLCQPEAGALLRGPGLDRRVPDRGASWNPRPGTPLFPDKSALDLDLVESKAFASGAVYLRYRVA